jgi:hypothetical protein
MAQVHLHARELFTMAERGALRLAMIVVGLLLTVVGLAMSISVVLLLPGVAIGFFGVCLLISGAVAELPIR